MASKKAAFQKFSLRFSKIGRVLTVATFAILVFACLIDTARTLTTVNLENREGVPLGWTELDIATVSPKITVDADDIIVGGFCDSILIQQSISNTNEHSNLLVTGMTSWLNRGVTYNPSGGFVNFSDGVSLEYSYNPNNNDWHSIAVSPPGDGKNDSLFKGEPLSLAPVGSKGDTVHFRYRFQPSDCDEGLFNVLSAKTEIDGNDSIRIESRTTSIRPVRRGVYMRDVRSIANNEYSRLGGLQFSTNSQGMTRLGRGILLERGGGTGTWVITFDQSAQTGEYAIAYSASSAGAFMITLNVASEGDFTFGDGGGHNTSINHIRFGQVDDDGRLVNPDTLDRITIEEYFAEPEEVIIEDDLFIVLDNATDTDEIEDNDDDDYEEVVTTLGTDEPDYILGSTGDNDSDTIITEDELETTYNRLIQVPNTGGLRAVNDIIFSRWWLVGYMFAFALCFALWRLNESYIIRNKLRENSKTKSKTKTRKKK
jgi:hypothetical protein